MRRRNGDGKGGRRPGQGNPDKGRDASTIWPCISHPSLQSPLSPLCLLLPPPPRTGKGGDISTWKDYNENEGKPKDEVSTEDEGKSDEEEKPEVEGKPEHEGQLQDQGQPDDAGKQEKQGMSEDEGKARGEGKSEPQAKPGSELRAAEKRRAEDYVPRKAKRKTDRGTDDSPKDYQEDLQERHVGSEEMRECGDVSRAQEELRKKQKMGGFHWMQRDVQDPFTPKGQRGVRGVKGGGRGQKDLEDVPYV